MYNKWRFRKEAMRWCGGGTGLRNGVGVDSLANRRGEGVGDRKILDQGVGDIYKEGETLKCIGERKETVELKAW